MSETVALSRVYGGLVNSIEHVNGFYFNEGERAQAIQLISDAFGEAIGLMSTRCPVCDSSDITIFCKDCAVPIADPPWTKIDDSDELADELEAELKSRGVM